MNLLQFGNRLLDTSDVVYAIRDSESTRLMLRGGHEVVLEGDVGSVVWSRLAGSLIDQMPDAEQAA